MIYKTKIILSMLEPSAGKLARWVLRGGTLNRAFLTRQRGANRIASSTLYELCEILLVPMSYFYEGIEKVVKMNKNKNPKIDNENLEKISKKFLKIENKEIRKSGVVIMKVLCDLDKRIANDNEIKTNKCKKEDFTKKKK